MTKEAIQPPLTEPEMLRQAIETFHIFTGVVLLSFAKHGKDLRDKIARNFVARGMSCTESIFAVWMAGSEQDAWILHRSLLDRLLHLRHLAETDGFTDFEEYSFRSLYKARHQLLSDPDMKAKVPARLKEIQQRDQSRYNAAGAKEGRWRRPKPKDVATRMGLGFLYQFGYDYASTHVHPMSDDGEGDFQAMTASPRVVALPDTTVVRNSILVQSMLVQEALNVSNMRWRAVVFDFLEQVRIFTGTDDPQFHFTFYKIGKAWPDFELCEPSKSSGGA